MEYLGTIHHKKPHETFIALGGFKLMYPLFDKTLASNLNET